MNAVMRIILKQKRVATYCDYSFHVSVNLIHASAAVMMDIE